ncbi:MAG: hypothetical protein H8D78_22575 [Chloroflexi bacterium]|nr:hypothetical protein [Chloroflexota bacterium]
MEFTYDQIRAFRYWIQGYANFYEPIVEEYFQLAGYRVLRRPALVGRADIQRIVNGLFDGHKQLGAELDSRAIRRHLEGRQRLQPDFLLEREGQRYLAELKSWGGFTASGEFDLTTARSEFLKDFRNGLFLLVDRLEGVPIAGKLLAVSSRSAEHDQVLTLLQRAYQTEIELLYLDEIFRMPQLTGTIERQLRYLDAACAELRQALGQTERGDEI